MAAKKDKFGIEALRTDVQALQESFRQFRDAMLTDAALVQAEQQQRQAALDSTGLPAVSDVRLTEVATLMAALGHPQRLQIAVALARNPTSVNDLVEQLGLGTTGAAYHHLKVLMNQGLVEQPQRGEYALKPDVAPKVQVLLTGLLGAGEDSDSGKSGKKKKK